MSVPDDAKNVEAEYVLVPLAKKLVFYDEPKILPQTPNLKLDGAHFNCNTVVLGPQKG